MRCTKTIDIIAPSITDVAPSLSDLRSLIAKGVKVRLITQFEKEKLDEYSTLPDEIEAVAPATPIYLDLTISDSNEALLSVTYRSNQKHNVWSSIDTYTLTMLMCSRTTGTAANQSV